MLRTVEKVSWLQIDDFWWPTLTKSSVKVQLHILNFNHSVTRKGSYSQQTEKLGFSKYLRPGISVCDVYSTVYGEAVIGLLLYQTEVELIEAITLPIH